MIHLISKILRQKQILKLLQQNNFLMLLKKIKLKKLIFLLKSFTKTVSFKKKFLLTKKIKKAILLCIMLYKMKI